MAATQDIPVVPESAVFGQRISNNETPEDQLAAFVRVYGRESADRQLSRVTGQWLIKNVSPGLLGFMVSLMDDDDDDRLIEQIRTIRRLRVGSGLRSPNRGVPAALFRLPHYHRV